MKNKTQLEIIHQKPTANLRHFFSTKSFVEICTLQAQRPTTRQQHNTTQHNTHAKNNKNNGTMVATIRRPPPAPI